MRKLKRHKNKRKVHIILALAIFLLSVMTIGYAAFSTNISLNAKGNVKQYTRTLATTYITNLKNNGDATLIDDGTTDHNIRYSGKNVNNYVCLENEKPCTNDNLYRIIGVFNNIKLSEQAQTGETRVKLIRATSIGNYRWNAAADGGADNNNWSLPASLNNTLQALPIETNTLIDNAVWNLGVGTAFSVTSSQLYVHERGNTGGNGTYSTTWIGKVGLMYPSDYGYASSACYSRYNLGGSNGTDKADYRNEICTGSNWLYLSSYEWTLSPYSSTSNIVFM